MSEQILTSEGSEFLNKNMVPLFAKYAISAFIGLLAQGIMVFCEGVIIGNGLGTMGLAVVSILMPIEYVNLALNGFFGIGVSTLCAMHMGNGDTEKAKKIFTGGVWYSFLGTAVVAIIIIIFANPIAVFLGATEDMMYIAPAAIRVFTAFIAFESLGQVANYMVRVDNHPKLGSAVVTVSAIISLAWLYLSTYVFHFGIIGAAVYYGLTIGLWAVLMVYFFRNKDTVYKFRMRNIRNMDFEVIKEVSKIGYPYFFVQIATAAFSVFINNMLGTETGLAAWAVLSGYIIYMLMMVMQACTQGVQPIASYNLGAGRPDRVKKALRVSAISEVVIVYIFAIACIIFNKPILSLLCGSDAELLNVTMQYNVIVCSTLALGMLADMLSGYFQSVERQVISTILALSRYIICGVPCILICRAVMGDMGIWYGMAIGNVAAFVLSIILMINENHRLNKSVKEEGKA